MDASWDCDDVGAGAEKEKPAVAADEGAVPKLNPFVAESPPPFPKVNPPLDLAPSLLADPKVNREEEGFASVADVEDEDEEEEEEATVDDAAAVVVGAADAFEPKE